MPESGGERAFGRVLITAKKAAFAYADLTNNHSANSEQILAWMRMVPEKQTFGVRSVVAETLGSDPAETAVKCGWFSDNDENRIRTHAVTITSCRHGAVGTVVLTALAMDKDSREEYSHRYRCGQEVLEIHERLAGGIVRDSTADAIQMLEL